MVGVLERFGRAGSFVSIEMCFRWTLICCYAAYAILDCSYALVFCESVKTSSLGVATITTEFLFPASDSRHFPCFSSLHNPRAKNNNNIFNVVMVHLLVFSSSRLLIF